MARTALRVHSPSVRTAVGAPSFRWMLALVIALPVIGPTVACSKPTSDNIQLWKTTQKGPDRLHEALADPAVAPRLRAEAAVGPGRHRPR